MENPGDSLEFEPLTMCLSEILTSFFLFQGLLPFWGGVGRLGVAKGQTLAVMVALGNAAFQLGHLWSGSQLVKSKQWQRV